MPVECRHCYLCNNSTPIADIRNVRGYRVCGQCYQTRSFLCHACRERCFDFDRGSEDSNMCYNCESRLFCWDAKPMTFNGKIKEIKSTRRFGVELETAECPGHTKLNGKTSYGSKYDGSISGMEFVSPILQGDQGLWATRGLCTRAKHMGFRVDDDCGYHLHLDVTNNTDLQIRHIASAYAYTHRFWCQLVKSYRAYDCNYCHPLTWTGDRMATEYHFREFCRDQNRYCWMNLQSFVRHGTIEIRLHEGTLDSKRICNWIKAHVRFADFVQDMKFHEIRNMFNVPERQMWRAVTNTWNDAGLKRYFRKVASLTSETCMV